MNLLKKIRTRKVPLLSDLREFFEEDYYREMNPELSGFDDLLHHYVTVGWKEGRDPATWFSTRGYLSAYPDIRAAAVNPFWHYITYGRSEKRNCPRADGLIFMTAEEFGAKTGVHLSEFPHDFSLETYAGVAGIDGRDRWKCLQHFALIGLTDPLLFPQAHAGSNLLTALGKGLAAQHPHKALFCLELASLKEKPDFELWDLLGKLNLDCGRFFSAREMFLRAIDMRPRSVWTLTNLAAASSELGLQDEAIRHSLEALQVQPGSYTARNFIRGAASRRFNAKWATANGLAAKGLEDEASAAILAAIDEYRSTMAPLRPSNVRPLAENSEQPKIAIFGSDSLFQCKLYRIEQKLDQLGEIGVKADFFSLSKHQALVAQLHLYDLLVVYRAPAIPDVIDVISVANAYEVPTFYDIDDLIFDAACYPPSRQSLGSMVSPAEYAGLITGTTLFREAMAMCDYGIASTPPIQQAVAKIVRNKQCFLHRNALGRAHMKVLVGPNRNHDGRIALFYGSGSRSHNENFGIISDALARVLRANPKAELHVVGPVELGAELRKLGGQIVQHPFTNKLDEYWAHLGRSDINLAPLTQGNFNDGKSEIKWMEAAMLGVPSIVSASAVYDETIRNGIDGIVAANAKEWELALKRLVSDQHLRKSMGNAARERVLAEYALAPKGQELLGSLRGAIGDKAISSQRKPLILTVNIFYPPQFIGGATRVVESNVTHLRDLAGDIFDFEVFCGREAGGPTGDCLRYDWNGTTVTSLSNHDDGDAIERSVDNETSFARLLDRLQPDIIHFHCIQNLTASLIDVARQRKVPFVVTAHDGWWISDEQFLIDANGTPVYESEAWGDERRLARLRDCLNSAHATLAVSETIGQIYEGRGITNVRVLPNGSQTPENVSPAPLEGPIWLGLLGGLGIAKGSELLRKILSRARFENLRFLIVDHAAPENSARTEWWGGNEVLIIGKTSFGNVSKVYSMLHGVLAISVCIESFGLVAREAARAGRWVIASNRGGMGEDVDDGINGFVIDVSNPAPLGDVLRRMDADPTRFRSPPPGARPQRDGRDQAKDLLELYQSMLMT